MRRAPAAERRHAAARNDRQTTENVECDDPLASLLALACMLWAHAAHAQDPTADLVTQHRSPRGSSPRSHRHGRATAVPQSAARAASAALAEPERPAATAATAGRSQYSPPPAPYSPPPPAPHIRRRRRRNTSSPPPPYRAAGCSAAPTRSAIQAAMATLSIRRSIRPRRARRVRSAPARPRPSRRRPVPDSSPIAGGPGRARPGRRSICRALVRAARCRTGGELPPPPAANTSATGAMQATLRRPCRRPTRRRTNTISLTAMSCTRIMGPQRDTFRDFLHKYPSDRLTPRGAILARRKPVPEPAISRCRRSVPRGVHQIRNHGARARRAVAAWPVARGFGRKGSRLRFARRGFAQISARFAEREAERRPGTEACPLLNKPFATTKRTRCSPVLKACAA